MLPDIKTGKKDQNAFHLAGIVPVAGQKLDFQFPWHDCFMPIANDLTAVENAVMNCSYAGCESIWIVAHREMQPILRHRIGDWIYEFGSLIQAKHAKKQPMEHLKSISIYYVPIHPKDRDRRDCLSWSVIYGALRAYYTSKTISNWVIPDKYFVSFPYGVIHSRSIYEHRELISSKKNYYMEHNGKTIRDGEYLPFTFGDEDFIKFRRVVRTGTGVYTNAKFDLVTRRMTQDTLPVDQRYSARWFSLDKVFGCATLEGNNVRQTPWYYPLDNWQRYTEYIAAKEPGKIMARPKWMKYKEWNPIGVDKEEDIEV
jgi:hypothetical protein